MLDSLEAKIGYHFRDRSLAQLALCHSSYSNEHGLGHLGCNERLEFLGDSVLSFVVADYLYHTEQGKPEGILSQMRANLVCSSNLASIAENISLGDELRLGVGAEKDGAKQKASVLEDALESLIAAVYLDGGLSASKNVIYRLVLDDFSEITAESIDYKSRLQELAQRDPSAKISYALLDSSGPEHNKVFRSAVLLNGVLIGEGSGCSKKKSEQAAAAKGIEAAFSDYKGHI